MDNKEPPRIIDFVNSLSTESGGYAFSKYAPDTILSTDFAVFSLHANGEIDALKRIEPKAAAYLCAARRRDGMFQDPRFVPRDLTGAHRTDYLLGQFTCYTLTALDLLGVHFDALPFFNPMLEEPRFRQWLERLDWSKFWYESNKIMFHLYYLAYLQKYGDPALGPNVEAALETAFEILNDKQDPDTGLWGTELNGGDLADGAFGAAHILLFYQYFEKPIPRADRILDSCLKLHAANGLVGDPEGGACEDYDLADIYLRLLSQHPTLRERTVDVLAKMRTVIENARSPEGGFPYRIPAEPGGLVSRFCSKLPVRLTPTYRYSGWQRMRTPVHRPDLWATFFRGLTLQVLAHILERTPFERSYHLPCWGFLT